MKKMKQKLHSNSGVSILFALLLFLVVSMVSATILSAAYSSVKRTHAVKEDTQSILALDSASLLMKKDMDSITYKALKTDDGYQEGTLNVVGNPFETEIVNISKKILNKNISTSDEEVFNIEATNLDTVTASYIVQVTQDNKTYIVVFTLETADENKTYVKFNVEKSENTTEANVSWSFFRISGKKY